MSEVRVRYAPSPTGSPHVGNIRTAVFDWLFARHSGGTFVLRIEDTDKNREVAGAIDEQLQCLSWLGLDYDEGYGKGGEFGPYLQSERLPLYREHVERLIAEGKAYRAYDTPEELTRMREDQQKRGLPTGYNRRHRYLDPSERSRYEIERGDACTVRFAVPLEGRTTVEDAVYGDISVENKLLEDVVLLKSDGFPTYHLAAIVDDHLMKISHVLRGEEWIPSAPIHLLLAQAFGWTPPVFVHLPVMLGPDKKKFGKRNGALPALEYKKNGILAEAMLNFLALQGWSPKEEKDIYSREDLIERFDLDGLINHSPISDPDKLLWYNGQYIRMLPVPDLAERTLPYLQERGLIGDAPNRDELNYIGEVISLEQERIKVLSEAPDLCSFFFVADDAVEYDSNATSKWFGHPGVGERLRLVCEKIAQVHDYTVEGCEHAVRSVIAETGAKGGEVIHPVRVAVTGRTTGPGLFEAMHVLGRTRVVNRLNRAISLTTG